MPTRNDSGQSDETLMRCTKTGDASAFAELYGRHGERAFRVARAVCRDRGQAEDAVQEGFLAIWGSRASYREGAAGFQAWAMKIVHNRAVDSTRSAAARPRLPPAKENLDRQAKLDHVSTQDLAISEGERVAVMTSLRLLPNAQSEVIVLAFYGELSHSEIAARLDLPTGTVKGRMRLGLKKLRREMEDAPDAEGRLDLGHRR
jgi:RNA polymerase sigma-70 factor, ECF subfamily